MFVRVRVPTPTFAQRRAALYRCRGVLAVFAGSVLAVLGALLWVELTPPMYLADVHTRTPGLLASTVLILVVQGAAVRICYRDELRRRRNGVADGERTGSNLIEPDHSRDR